MLPALQPSRPKRRASHEQPQQPLTGSALNTAQQVSSGYELARPRSQIKAMPPFGPARNSLLPAHAMYDSAVRHPVFFTENLRKSPFPIPSMGSHGWSPVACGYIMEQRKAELNGMPKTKL
ncbi:hypothetical protein BDV95DRAFT_627267 [Massariosphaeria phaeospora]|uniref:Uncharacterized protein n=1 Tax=Massariosphaeria phaeospora TaxID=100035 RepID=A0A7C8MEH0_9PLEO|nr:hypothetical protein BDV95DRAFT_627267 [Massariosphaeria phaeospora]